MKLLVVDNGINTEFAYRLGVSGLFTAVSYFAPWQSDFVATRERAVGTGFDEYKRIYCIDAATLASFDAFAFPSLYFKDLALQLRDDGCAVWSAFEAEDYELDRVRLLGVMKGLGMTTPDYKVVKGVDAALRHARDGDFIKITGLARGDAETVRHSDRFPQWATTLRERLGPLADTIPIVVQRPIEGDVEGGYDFLIVKGEPVYPFTVGYEDKDMGYIAHVTDVMPPLYEQEHGKLMKLFRGTDYTQFMSTEYRGNTLIDLTCRVPSPPGELSFYLYHNLPQLIYDYFEGSSIGRLAPRNKYAAELMITNEAPKEYGWIDAPDELRANLSLSRAFRHDGVLWIAPNANDTNRTFGGVVATGSSAEKAVNEAARILKEIKMSPNLDCGPEVAYELLKTAEKGEEEGIPF